jgi:hypothetical protein
MARRKKEQRHPHQRNVKNVMGKRDCLCFLGYIKGFEEERVFAENVLGDVTREMSKARVFVTCRKGFVYLHCNYIQPGRELPAKLSSNHVFDLPNLVANLMLPQEEFNDDNCVAEFTGLFAKFTYLIDPPALNPKYGLDFSSCRAATVLLQGGLRQVPLHRYQESGGEPPTEEQLREDRAIATFRALVELIPILGKPIATWLFGEKRK